MFWVLNLEDVKNFYKEQNILFEPQVTQTGDDCHGDIKGIPTKKESKFFDEYFCKADKFWCKGDKKISIPECAYDITTFKI